MNTRYLSRIGTLQLKPTLTFKHGGKASLAHKPKLKIRTTSKPKIKRILTFKDELDNVRIRTRRSPSSKDPEPSSHVNAILAADAFKDRIFRYTMKSCDDDDFTVVSFFKIKDKDGNLERGGLLMIFNFGPIRIGRYSNILRQAASTVARLLERWPHTLDFSNKQKKVLADVALERTSSNRSKIYPTIEFNPLRSIYWSTVNGIDPDSGESYSVFVGVRPKNITDFEVPETPKTERFALHETSGFHPQTVKDATQQEAPTSPISDEGTSYESKKREAAIKILQLVLWKYHSKILRLSDVQYATEEIVLKYAARTKGSSGPYEGKPLYQLFSYRAGEYEFRPSIAVKQDTSPGLPSITLVGSQAPATLRVGDAIVSTWTSTGDLKKAWLAGWETAQAVNEEAKAAGENTIDKDYADWKVSKKPLNIRTLGR